MYYILSQILKYVLIFLIYLFLYRVFKIIYMDIKGVRRERQLTSAKLSFLTGERTFTLFEVTSIGRSDECDIVIESPYVSARHALIKKRGKRFYIEDLNSTNGTFVNGKRVKVARIKNGDIITLGDVDLKFIV
ncbi:MAG: FHA-domain-containing protein [Caldanaerobacter subterraneus]|uniref:FHA-domain-containing proteins n=2 Tax=Caldanaerobacter subterraneus TaxID=911092 RepID=Q8R8M6_CALS4|nr:FHA domain-containing protein [Caldanaerobacter subterraneus]AAM25148.1 FHA-domain-containing proteins [Caldanaerobacter subterraneus subsp. tengcongensis MB4]KUK09429.1 MAG: FHA-domain-containing protein [Caldanaerobacter subterraneus]HBT49678.1 FHA domain-containing protein [Caldanaerobacter subterraneus]